MGNQKGTRSLYVYGISRLQQWEITRGGASYERFEGLVVVRAPAVVHEPHNGDNDMHSHKLCDDETAGYRGPFPTALENVFLERGRKEFFDLFHQNSTIYFASLFPFRRKTWFLRYFCLASIPFIHFYSLCYANSVIKIAKVLVEMVFIFLSENILFCI